MDRLAAETLGQIGGFLDDASALLCSCSVHETPVPASTAAPTTNAGTTPSAFTISHLVLGITQYRVPHGWTSWILVRAPYLSTRLVSRVVSASFVSYSTP